MNEQLTSQEVKQYCSDNPGSCTYSLRFGPDSLFLSILLSILLTILANLALRSRC